MATMPIIMVHCHLPWPVYMATAVIQAVRMNPGTPVYVITDGPKENYPGIEVIAYDHFKSSIDEFRKVFFHVGALPFEFERTCIERWFVIRDFMRERQFTQAFCMDSDVLMFSSVASMHQRFLSCDYTILSGHSWGTVFFNKRSVLEDFCDFVWKLYNRDPQVWPAFAERVGFSRPYHQLQITDMVLIKYFKELTAGQYSFKEQAEISPERRLIDPTFAAPAPGLEMEGNFKKVVWVGPSPYCVEQSTGLPVKMDIIHFSGVEAKGCMMDFLKRHAELAACVQN